MASLPSSLFRRVLLSTALVVSLTSTPLMGAFAQGGGPAGPLRSCPPPSEAPAVAGGAATQVPASNAQPPAGGAAPLPAENPYQTRIVIVEWKIKKGRECDFLNYWSTRSTIPNRAGLIGEFLNEVDKRAWVNWSLDDGWTTFYNIGIWRDAADFEDQIGKYIDNARPPLEFEAAKRARVFLAPERWRIGSTALPTADPAGVR